MTSDEEMVARDATALKWRLLQMDQMLLHITILSLSDIPEMYIPLQQVRETLRMLLVEKGIIEV